MRLIDAYALINELNNSHYPGAPYIDAGISIAIGKVCDAPTIEPERKTARWIEDGYSHYKAVCSECGEPCATYVVNTPRDRFCKWCGAKMEGENETD